MFDTEEFSNALLHRNSFIYAERVINLGFYTLSLVKHTMISLEKMMQQNILHWNVYMKN